MWSHHFTANRWGNNGNSDRLHFLGSKITKDGGGSHEIKRRLLLGEKVMTNLASILKSKDFILPTKLCLVKVMVFPVVMYGCESWTIKKAEHRRIDGFELWCWRLLSPLDCKEIQPVYPKGNQSWIFTGRTDAEAETPIIWPPDVNEELTHWKRPWCWERLKAGGEEGNRGWDGWMASPTQWTWVWVNSGSWWWTGRPGVLQPMGSQRVRHNWATGLKNDCVFHWHCNLFRGRVGFGYSFGRKEAGLSGHAVSSLLEESLLTCSSGRSRGRCFLVMTEHGLVWGERSGQVTSHTDWSRP